MLAFSLLIKQRSNMKTMRKEYPRVRQYVKHGNTYYQVDLRRKHYQGPGFKNFTDREAALKFASEIASKVSLNGLSAISVVGVDPQVIAWREQFAIYNKTLEEAIQVALDVFEKEREVKESPYVAELLSVWVDDKTSNTLKPLRERSKESLRNMADIFKKDFGLSRIKEITQEGVEQYLSERECSQQYRENLRNYLSQFFNWCRKKKYHNENPAEHVEVQIVRDVPKFFSVEQCQSIMREASKAENRCIAPFYAICLFGGVRPKEVERMTWDNIRGEEIYLAGSITKTKKDRIFKMSDNLKAWIESCRDVKPLVPPSSNVKKLRDKISKNLHFEWIPDGLRHTFATFHYAKYKSFEELRHVMGNSPGIIDRFYKGAISHKEVEKFWSITPASLQNPTASDSDPDPTSTDGQA
jgi:integrase